RSTDQAGNVEEASTTEVPVDTVAPVTTAEVVDEEAQAVVTLTAVDATSGVALTEVAVGDGDWTAYDEPLVVSGPGTQVVSFRSTDEAVLVEETQSVEVEVGPGEVDTTGPVVTIQGVRDGAVYGHAARRPLRWTVTPTGSPVATVTALLDGSPVQQGRLDLSTLSLGAHRLVVTATDEAGNSTTESVRFTVRSTPADVRKLVKRFAKDGSMTKVVRKDLVRGLTRAQRLAQRKPQAAVAELRQVRKVAKQIRKKSHRKLVRKDVKVLIRGLK
ncbi:MAG: hypothetical protein Q8Q44_18540, partial [Nocardioides sp.]|nr:hypothetical protein [Nocardioides sp.]